MLYIGPRELEENTRIRVEFEASSAIQGTSCCGIIKTGIAYRHHYIIQGAKEKLHTF